MIVAAAIGCDDCWSSATVWLEFELLVFDVLLMVVGLAVVFFVSFFLLASCWVLVVE